MIYFLHNSNISYIVQHNLRILQYGSDSNIVLGRCCYASQWVLHSVHTIWSVDVAQHQSKIATKDSESILWPIGRQRQNCWHFNPYHFDRMSTFELSFYVNQHALISTVISEHNQKHTGIRMWQQKIIELHLVVAALVSKSVS